MKNFYKNMTASAAETETQRLNAIADSDGDVGRYAAVHRGGVSNIEYRAQNGMVMEIYTSHPIGETDKTQR